MKDYIIVILTGDFPAQKDLKILDLILYRSIIRDIGRRNNFVLVYNFLESHHITLNFLVFTTLALCTACRDLRFSDLC